MDVAFGAFVFVGVGFSRSGFVDEGSNQPVKHF